VKNLCSNKVEEDFVDKISKMKISELKELALKLHHDETTESHKWYVLERQRVFVAMELSDRGYITKPSLRFVKVE